MKFYAPFTGGETPPLQGILLLVEKFFMPRPLPWILTRQVPFGAQFLKSNPHFNKPPSAIKSRVTARLVDHVVVEGARATLEFAQISFCSQAPSVTCGDSSLPEGAYYGVPALQ